MAPASAPRDAQRYQQGIERLRETYELDVRYRPEQCAKPYGYLAASDEERANQLNEALRDDSARAVIAARGGYGCTRILDRVDVNAAAQHPKWIIGYSDITALQWFLYKETGLVSASAPVVTEFAHFTAGFADPPNAHTARRPGVALSSVLDDTHTSAWSAFEPVVSEPAKPQREDGFDLLLADQDLLRAVHPGKATVRGPLLAGTLSVIVALAGTEYMPNLHGAVLVLEDTGEAPYRVDRMLTQLRQSGCLTDLAAVVLGSFRTGDVRPPTLDMETVLHEAFAPFDYPVLHGLPYGHILPRLTLPIGAPASVDPRPGRFSLSVKMKPSGRRIAA